MTNSEAKPPKLPSRDAVTTALEVSGMLLICGAVATIYWQAGAILAGLAALAMSWRLSR